jgi:hypothetical protein
MKRVYYLFGKKLLHIGYDRKKKSVCLYYIKWLEVMDGSMSFPALRIEATLEIPVINQGRITIPPHYARSDRLERKKTHALEKLSSVLLASSSSPPLLP